MAHDLDLAALAAELICAGMDMHTAHTTARTMHAELLAYAAAWDAEALRAEEFFWQNEQDAIEAHAERLLSRESW